MRALVGLVATFGACAFGGCAPPPAVCPDPVVAVVEPAPPSEEDAAAIAAVLDDWHAAAAEGAEERYFGHFTDDAVFLGTDQTERWTVAAFREYASPHFEDGHGWTMRPSRRDIVVHGDHAYFDEDLTSEGLGPVRGSGVARRVAGRWAIAHYVLSFTIPNDKVRALQAMLAESADAQTESSEDADE